MMQISVYLKSGKSLEAVVNDIKTSDQLIRYFDENTKSALLIPISNIEFLECQDVE